jgi:predicted secreted protein
MSQPERDVLKVIQKVVDGALTQVEAARLLRLSTRQIRRLRRRFDIAGDQAVVHRLRGRPSNRRIDDARRQKILAAYRRDYPDFGPTFASEKLAEQGLAVSPETLRQWLLAAGLWQRQRQRDPHRQRRPRRACFGELVQMDTSIHDWTEGRGEPMVLVNMIDDATSRVLSGFYPGETVEAHFDLLGRWLKRYGRPVALYTDRDSIFEYQDKGRGDPGGLTQFGRALRELDMELILARSPQAKGRVERFFETAQDRWVKELRLAKVVTREQANALLDNKLIADFNRRFAVAPAQAADAHRPLGVGHHLAAILSVQHERRVSNDYTVRFQNRVYQVGKPAYPGLRGGRVVIELRLDGTMALRFGQRYLRYAEIPEACGPGGSAPRPPEFSALAADARQDKTGPAPAQGARPAGVPPATGRSGRTPAEPYPPDGEAEDSRKGPWRPAADHPWRRGFKGKR